MYSLESTVREALRAGHTPQNVIDVLLEHGVSSDEVLDVWPDTVHCPLHESKEFPTPEDVAKGIRGEKPSFADVPSLDSPTPDATGGRDARDQTVLNKVRSLLK